MKNKIIIYPTDTVYGIGGNALDNDIIKKIHKIKKSPQEKPMSVIMADMEMIKNYCEINEEQEKILKKYLPGPFTFIVKMKVNIPCGKDGTIGIRIPKNSEIVGICEKLGVPIITTSANFHGGKNPSSLDEIPKEIIKEADILIKGKTDIEPSTVVDLINKKIIRQGIATFSF